MVRTIIQEFLEAEMAEAVGAEKGERVEGAARLSQRRPYLTQLDHAGGQAGTESSAGPPRTVFHRDFRALSAQREGLAGGVNRDVYPGVSTRKVKAISEELCGHSFSASGSISGFIEEAG